MDKPYQQNVQNQHPLPPADHTPVQRDLSFLNDVALSVSAELGRCEISIRTLIGLTKGSIITLGDETSAHVTLRANGKEIGRGEIVTVNDKFGVRVTSVSEPSDR